jgi:hypothetical protein
MPQKLVGSQARVMDVLMTNASIGSQGPSRVVDALKTHAGPGLS